MLTSQRAPVNWPAHPLESEVLQVRWKLGFLNRENRGDGRSSLIYCFVVLFLIFVYVPADEKTGTQGMLPEKGDQKRGEKGKPTSLISVKSSRSLGSPIMVPAFGEMFSRFIEGSLTNGTESV